jgi:hypothetical protein
MAPTLDYWFGNNTHNNKTIFYFDSNTMNAKWLYKKDLPKDVSYSTIIKWNGVSINVCSNLSQTHKYIIPQDTNYSTKQITFLKSLLQKCIRRQLNDQTIKTAYHLIKINIVEFLRRITIIIIEDVILHESYSILVWLMIAVSTKNKFLPDKNIIDWLLGLVNTLCNIKEFGEIGYDSNKYDISNLDDHDILYSLQLRINYGGMDCDMKMLNYITDLWLKKFKAGEQYNCECIKAIDSNEIKNLTISDWKLDGDNMVCIDFHCAPYILDTLSNKHNYSLEEIKSAIWNCSSSINYRKSNIKTQYDLKIWKIIESDFYKLQKNIFNKYILNH